MHGLANWSAANTQHLLNRQRLPLVSLVFIVIGQATMMALPCSQRPKHVRY